VQCHSNNPSKNPPTTFAVGDTKQPWWFRVPISGHTLLEPLLYLPEVSYKAIFSEDIPLHSPYII